MNRFMRMMVMFDLPVSTAKERRAATGFRKFLLNDGYYMIQFSVYVRICNGFDDVEKHRRRLYKQVPANGSIRLLTVTEKQYEAMDIIVGEPTEADAPFQMEQLTIF